MNNTPPVFFNPVTQRDEFCLREDMNSGIFLGMNCALYLPNICRVSGGTADALDSIPTDSLPDSFWISFQDNNEETQSGTMNFYLVIGTVPEGAESPQIVIPLDNATSGAFWRKG